MRLHHIYAAAAALVFVAGVARAQTAPPGPPAVSVNAPSVGYTATPDPNAVTRTAQTKLFENRSVEDDSAAGNNITNDSTAINNAIAYFNGAGGAVNLKGGYAIAAPIMIGQTTGRRTTTGIVLQGGGCCGRSSVSPLASFLRATSALSGQSMITIGGNIGSSIKGIRLIGDSAAPPQAAITFNATSGSFTFHKLEDFWIGNMFGLDTDTGNQFVDGIDMVGSVNGDTNEISYGWIQGVTGVGINQTNCQAGSSFIHTMNIYGAGTGISTCDDMLLANIDFNTTGYNFVLNQGGATNIYGLGVWGVSSPLFFNNTAVGGGAAVLSLHGGGFQPYNMAAGGVIATAGTASPLTLDLEDWTLIQPTPNTYTPLMTLYATNGATASSIYANLVGDTGLYPSNFTFGTVLGAYDAARQAIYCGPPPGPEQPMPCDRFQGDYTHAEDRSYTPWATQYHGKSSVFMGPFIVRQELAPTLVGAAVVSGSGSTSYYYVVTAVGYDGEETTASSETHVTNQNATLSSTASNRVTWAPVPGAMGYNIYRGSSSGGETFLAQATWNSFYPGNGVSMATFSTGYVDNGAATPTMQAPPTVNNTGQGIFEGPVTAGAFIRPTLTTVAGLAAIDASPQAGDRAAVSDATACITNTSVTGGGSTSCAVIYSGSAWKAEVTH